MRAEGPGSRRTRYPWWLYALTALIMLIVVGWELSERRWFFAVTGTVWCAVGVRFAIREKAAKR